MSDMTRVELASLAAAKQKLRKLTVEAEQSGDSNMVHSAYKVGEFLGTALPDTDPDYLDLISDAAVQAAIEQIGGAE